MSFLPRDAQAGAALALYWDMLESLLRERAPELADRIERLGSPPGLRVRLDESTSVTLALSGRAMSIRAPGDLPRVRLWEPNTPTEILVDATIARATACLTGKPEASPWRWDEAEESEQTRLADLLSDAGFEVQTVVRGNRMVIPDEADMFDTDAARDAPAADGAYVRARRNEVEVRVTRKPILGWIADVQLPEDLGWRRLDLRELITGQPSTGPGVDAGLTELVQALTADGEPLAEISPVRPRADELVTDVATQLRAMAFGDVMVREDPSAPLHSEAFHVVWLDDPERSLGQPKLKQFIADSAMEGKDLLVISEGPLTRGATTTANRPPERAKVAIFVFKLEPGSGLLSPGNDRAEDACLTGWEAELTRRTRW